MSTDRSGLNLTALGTWIAVALTSALIAATPAAADYAYVSEFGGPGSGDGQLQRPSGIDVDPAGNIYVADSGNNRIQKFTPDGIFSAQWNMSDPTSNPQLKLSYPVGIAVDPAGSFVWVTDSGHDSIIKYTTDGVWKGRINDSDAAPNKPTGISVDPDGNLVTANFGTKRVTKFAPSGELRDEWDGAGSAAGALQEPWGLATDSAGTVYVTDVTAHRVVHFDMAADAPDDVLGVFGTFGAGPGELSTPFGVETDAVGNVYVADLGNNRIQKFDAAGNPLTSFGSAGTGPGQFEFPHDVAVDAAGNVYVVDNAEHILKFAEPSATAVPGPDAGSNAPDAGSNAGDVSAQDLTRPTISKASVRCKRARSTRDRRRGCRSGRAVKLTYKLSEEATVSMTIDRKRGGRRVGTRSASGLASTNSVKLSSVANGRALRPGTYRVKLAAIDSAGNRSRTKRVRFRVAR